MQQYFLPSSAWIRRLWNERRPRDVRSLLSWIFALGVAGVALLLETRVDSDHGVLSPVLLGLLAYPAFPRNLDDHFRSTDQSQPDVAKGFPLAPVLEEISALIDGVFQARVANFVLGDERRGGWFTGSIERVGSRVELRCAHSETGSPLLALPWQTVALTKSASGIASTGLDRDGKVLGIVGPFEELSAVWPGEFKRLLISKLEISGRWTGHVTFCDFEFHKEDQFAVRALQRIVEVAVRDYEMQIANCDQARSDERERIARNLHDGAIQSLSAAEMRLEEIRQTMLQEVNVDGAETLASVQNLIIREIRKLREQIDCLRKGTYDEPLEPRLGELIRDFERSTGISTSFSYRINEEIVSPTMALELVYLIQEGLSNVRKHSRSKCVEIALSGEDSILLTIEDHGCGLGFSGKCSLEKLEQCGLVPCVIRERVVANGGTLTITSSCESGTRLCISLPAGERVIDSNRISIPPSEPESCDARGRKGPRSIEEARYRSVTRTHG